MKEYHVWDVLDIPLLIKNRVDRKVSKSNAQSIRFAMQNNSDFYFDYFSALYSEKHLIAADFTPSYSGLKADRLEKIQVGFQKRSIDVKAIILIRDPLSRIKSAVRFNLDRKNYNEGIVRGELDFSDALAQYYLSQHCALRTNYQEIITEARSSFGDDNLFIGVYENLFNSVEVVKLTNFLGIDLNAGYANVKINQTKGVVSETLIDLKIKKHYAKVYDYCFKNFPITQDLWSQVHW